MINRPPPPSLYRMVYNSISYEVLNKYKDNKLSEQQALTKLNELVDYVRDNEAKDNRRNSKNHEG